MIVKGIVYFNVEKLFRPKHLRRCQERNINVLDHQPVFIFVVLSAGTSILFSANWDLFIYFFGMFK